VRCALVVARRESDGCGASAPSFSSSTSVRKSISSPCRRYRRGQPRPPQPSGEGSTHSALHVLRVAENSPAAEAGIEPFFDFVVSPPTTIRFAASNNKGATHDLLPACADDKIEKGFRKQAESTGAATRAGKGRHTLLYTCSASQRIRQPLSIDVVSLAPPQPSDLWRATTRAQRTICCPPAPTTGKGRHTLLYTCSASQRIRQPLRRV
jgi:hypothetical protein